MRQFLMLVGVAAVAAAMYVAAASGSPQSKGPTAKQFSALKKQVAALSKSLKSVKGEVDAVASIAVCDLTTNPAGFDVLPVSAEGNDTVGFLFGTAADAAPQTALAPVGANPQYNVQVVNPSCMSGALKHAAVRSAVSRLQRSVRVH